MDFGDDSVITGDGDNDGECGYNARCGVEVTRYDTGGNVLCSPGTGLCVLMTFTDDNIKMRRHNASLAVLYTTKR